MEIHYGNGGWVRVIDEDMPGDLYLRLQPDERGRWRTVDFYLRGAWRPIVGADLRELGDLAAIEEIVQSANPDALTHRSEVPGPDLSTLASSYSTVYGTGTYGGRHCDSCDAPLRYAVPRKRERWANDWHALSWFAQDPDSPIHRPEVKDEPLATYSSRTKVPRLQRPTGGLTDEFLEHVRDAYLQAVAEGLSPAPELARQVGEGTSVRTIHKWVSVARKRGILGAASRPGRPG